MVNQMVSSGCKIFTFVNHREKKPTVENESYPWYSTLHFVKKANLMISCCIHQVSAAVAKSYNNSAFATFQASTTDHILCHICNQLACSLRPYTTELLNKYMFYHTYYWLDVFPPCHAIHIVKEQVQW